MNILVLEDDRLINECIAKFLESLSYQYELELIQCYSFEDYKEVFSKQKIDIGILDINLNSEKDGIDCAEELMKIQKSDVILLSEYVNSETINKAKGLGQLYFLTKPFNREQLQVAFDFLYEKRVQMIESSKSESAKILPLIDLYKTVLDKTSLVSITDTNGYILEANEEFCKLSGYEKEELLGKKHNIIKSGHHPRSFFEEMWETITSGKIWKGEVKNRKKNGGFYWVYSTIVPLMDPDTYQITRYISIRQDITSKKILEENYKDLLDVKTNELSTSQNELLKLSKISIVNSLTTTIAHDIKTPLSSLRLTCQLIKSELTGLSEQKMKLLEKAEMQLNGAISVVENIYKMMKADPEKLNYSYDPLVACKNTLRMISNDICSTNLDIQYFEKSPSTLEKFNLSQEHFEQAILNLAQNSIRAMSKTERDPRIKINFTKEKDHINLSFYDNGFGVDKEKEKRLFDVGKSFDGGAGIGLNLVCSSLENVGGRIEVGQNDREGLELVLKIPFMAEKER